MELANALHPAVTDLSSDDCRIVYRRRQPDGQVKTKELNGRQMKTLMKTMLTAARPRSGKSVVAIDVVSTEEALGIRVTGKKHNLRA